jgi:PAS domain S-box-containing protein
MSNAQKSSRGGVATVVLAYAAFAGLWILLSDRVMGLLIADPGTLVWASMLKGWFFVAVTSLLLYGLVRRLANALGAAHARELMHEREREKPPPMLMAIADASADAIYAKDEAGRYLLFNNAAAAIVGQPAAQVLGQDDRALFPPEQADQLMAIHRRVYQTGYTETSEDVLQTAAGERVFLATKGPLRDDQGRIFGTYGILRDITLRKREEQAARELADDLQTTLQAIPDLMFEHDAQGRYLRVKASDEALLAAPSSALLGRTAHEVLPADAAATLMAALAAAARAGTDYGRTIALPLGSGRRDFELSVARKAMQQGQPDRFIVLSRDITHRVAAEAVLRRRNEELERFNRTAVDRELRMVELKQEVNRLALAAGRPAPYDTSFAAPIVDPASS